MITTVMVRRIDFIGRVFIPKEVRKILNFHDGEPLEIFIDQKERTVCFKPYEPCSQD